jgi:hypothetical protein
MSFTLKPCKGCHATGDWGRDGTCGSCVVPASSADFGQIIIPEVAKIVQTATKKKEIKPSVAGKPSISLIPREAILEMSKAFDYGTGKHGRYAFREGVEFSKLLDAAMRHCLAMTDGEDIDEESGALHAACAMSNLAMLIFCMKQKPEFDDRWKKK